MFKFSYFKLLDAKKDKGFPSPSTQLPPSQNPVHLP